MNNSKGPLWKSFYHAFCGIKNNVIRERNLKIHIMIMLIVILLGSLFKICAMEWMICLILFGLVISLELVNTAIEVTVDIYIHEFDEKAKIAKDTAAGAVLVAAFVSIIIGFVIFLPKCLEIVKTIIK